MISAPWRRRPAGVVKKNEQGQPDRRCGCGASGAQWGGSNRVAIFAVIVVAIPGEDHAHARARPAETGHSLVGEERDITFDALLESRGGCRAALADREAGPHRRQSGRRVLPGVGLEEESGGKRLAPCDGLSITREGQSWTGGRRVGCHAAVISRSPPEGCYRGAGSGVSR